MALKKLTNSNEQLDSILRCLNYWSIKSDKNITTSMIDGVKINQAPLSCNHDDFRKQSDLLLDLAFIEKNQIDSKTLELALEHLTKEELIKYDLCYTHKEINGYRILYKGKIFIENGGYVQQKINIDNEKNHNRYMEKVVTSMQYQIATLTFWIVILTAAAVLISGLTFYHQYCR